jgi:hypothetical protein
VQRATIERQAFQRLLTEEPQPFCPHPLHSHTLIGPSGFLKRPEEWMLPLDLDHDGRARIKLLCFFDDLRLCFRWQPPGEPRALACRGRVLRNIL